MENRLSSKEQTILACDDNGRFLEYIPKEVGHRGEGRRHLAITVLLYNSKNEILLQRRKHKVFNNIWDFTASTHPLHKENGTDESLEEAARRCLKQEWEISPSTSLRVKEIGVFNYFAKDGKNCENENDHLLVALYDGEVKLNSDAGYSFQWVKWDFLVKEMEKSPEQYSAWANEGLKLLKTANFLL